MTPKKRIQFPRGVRLPAQSFKFWAKEKDRYLRQLLIGDIEEQTGNKVIVYFAIENELLTAQDSEDLCEVIQGYDGEKLDLILHTPGGGVNEVEKFISILRKQFSSYRVILPGFAKSGGTVVALSAKEIVFGVSSELGPIDPQMIFPDYGLVPCQYIADDTEQPSIIRRMAHASVGRMKNLAKKYLRTGMMKGKNARDVSLVVEKISSPASYGSHRAVIDYDEATAMGLAVRWLDVDDLLWQRIRLLYSMYEFDVHSAKIRRIMESVTNSIATRS